MKNKLKKHLFYYFLLVLILSFGAVLSILASPNIILQSIIIFITVIFYVSLGLIHHYLNHELTSKIMIEYGLIGGLGLSILFFMVGGIL